MPGQAYVFFAHVIKGQPFNMPMLQRMLDLGCTLIDYEKVTDDAGRRLIFFGWHAGVAGMLETLWALGQRLAWQGIANPFTALRRAYDYHDIAEAKAAVQQVGEAIRPRRPARGDRPADHRRGRLWQRGARRVGDPGFAAGAAGRAGRARRSRYAALLDQRDLRRPRFARSIWPPRWRLMRPSICSITTPPRRLTAPTSSSTCPT